MTERVKIIGLALNKKFGILEAQELKFEKSNGLTLFKGAVGTGKTTAKNAMEMASSNNKLADTSMYGDEFDVELQLTDGKMQLWSRVYKNSGKKPITTIYTKDENNKKIVNPVIDGIQITPAKYLESLRTALTFGVEDFLSEHLKTQQKFIMKLFGDQLEALGIYDKKHEKYEGSLKHKIELEIALRSDQHYKRRQINGFMTALESEGFTEAGLDSMKSINVVLINAKIAEFEVEKRTIEDDVLKHNSNIESNYDTKIEGLKSKALIIINELKEFNRAEIEIVEIYNKKIIENNKLINNITENALELMSRKLIIKECYDDIEALIPEQQKEKIPISVLFEEDGKLSNTQQFTKLPDWVSKKIIEITDLRKKAPKKDKERIADNETLELSSKINVKKEEIMNATVNNKLIERFKAFKDWSETNQNVIDLNSRLAETYEQVNTFVPGLKLIFDAERDENGSIISGGELKVYYSGEHDSEFFGNKDRKQRLIISYSGTQKPIIAILLQIELMKRKEKVMPYIWIEAPIDNKTKNLLEDLCLKHSLTILTSVTGDFKYEKLEDGDVLIENGQLLMKPTK